MSPRPSTASKEKKLAGKVAKIMRAVKKLEKYGTNDAGSYSFTRATDVFEQVRDRLFADGILLMPDEGEPVYVSIETNGGEAHIECRLPVTYTFTDGETELKPRRCNGVGRDHADKALYKAQTGSRKAFLKAVGLMAEETDDPEYEDAAETLDDVAPLKGAGKVPRRERPLTEYEIANIREGMAATGKTEAQLSEMVSQLKAESIESVQNYQFKKLLKWATDGQGTIHAPKPQAVPTQNALPLGRPPEPIEMRIGNKSIQFEPKERATFSV